MIHHADGHTCREGVYEVLGHSSLPRYSLHSNSSISCKLSVSNVIYTNKLCWRVSLIKFSDECASCVVVTNTWRKRLKERRPYYSSWSTSLGPMYLDGNIGRTSTWQMRSIHYIEDKAEWGKEERQGLLIKLVSPRVFFLFLDSTS